MKLNLKKKIISTTLVCGILLNTISYASGIKTDLTLEEAVKIGIENSEILELSKNGMEIQKIELSKNKSDHIKQDRNRRYATPMEEMMYDAFTGTIQYDQHEAEVDIKRTRNKIEEMEMTNEYIKKTLESNISKVYYGGLQAKDMLDIKRDTFKNLEENYNIVKKKFDLGTASQYDLNMMEIDLNNGRIELEKAEDSYKEVMRNLNNLLDYPLETSLNLTTGYKPREFTSNINKDLDLAFDNRYDYIIAKNDLDLERLNFDILKKNYTPNTFIYRKADVGLKSMELQFKNMKKNIEADIKAKYDNLVTSKNEIALMDANIRKAEEGLRVLKLQYDLDMATMIQVNEALVGLNQAKLGKANAIGNFNVAVIDYETAVKIGSLK